MSQPWAIRAASMAVIMDSFAYKDELGASAGKKDDDAPYNVDECLATISISGVIGKKLPKWMTAFGMIDVDNIAKAISAANADDSVKAIFLEIDSPGGSVTGVPEAARLIRNSAKPVYAYSETLCASAAYWLASGATGIFASESALVGSIGVFVPIADMRRMFEMAGIEMDVIKAGTLKAAGYPGTSLSAEQRADLQSSVDFIYAMFTSFISERESANGMPSRETMQGQDFYGEQALEACLVDGIGRRDEILTTLKKLANY